jgi:hypothetical protein
MKAIVLNRTFFNFSEKIESTVIANTLTVKVLLENLKKLIKVCLKEPSIGVSVSVNYFMTVFPIINTVFSILKQVFCVKRGGISNPTVPIFDLTRASF